MKHKTFFALSISIIALATFFAANFITGNTFLLAHADYVPKSLTLNKDNKCSSLPANGSQTYDPIEYELPGYLDSTIELVYASKKDDNFARLNSRVNEYAEPAYFLKQEASKGMFSFTIKLDGGSVDVLSGYKPGVYLYKETITGTSPVTKTIKGNYFKVVNFSTTVNALVRYFTINYNCLVPETEELNYSFDSGTGKYLANVDTGDRELNEVGRVTADYVFDGLTTSYAEGGSLSSNQYTLPADAKVYMDLSALKATTAHLILMLSNSTVEDAYLDEALDIYVNDTHLELPHKELIYDEDDKALWREVDCGEVSVLAGNNTITLKSLASNGLVLGYGALIDPATGNPAARVLDTTTYDYYLSSGGKSTARSNPGKWYYQVEKSDYCRVTQPVCANGVVSGSIINIGQNGDGTVKGLLTLRYMPMAYSGASIELKYTLTIKTNFTGEIIVKNGVKRNVTANTPFVINGDYTVNDSGETMLVQFYNIAAPADGGPLTYQIYDYGFYENVSASEGDMATVSSNPNHWYYNANGGGITYDLSPKKMSDETKIGLRIKTRKNEKIFLLRFCLFGEFQNQTFANGDNVTLTFDLYVPYASTLGFEITNVSNTSQSFTLHEGYNRGVSINTTVVQSSNSKIYQLKLDEAITGFVELSNFVVTKKAA